jgi:hypothetical protein
MALHALNFQRPHVVHQAWRLLMACAFGLLTACGGGGGGATISNPNTTAPTVSLTATLPTGAPLASDGIYSGNPVLLTPSYAYGTAQISWTDAAGATQTLQVTSTGTPVQVNPTQTTAYTLTVLYQDPGTIQPKQLSTTASATVTIKPTETLLPSALLSPSASTITLGSNVTLTPTFAWTGGTITKSVVNDGTNDIAVSSGTPIVVTPSQNTTYTLKLEYLDQRVIPSIAKTAQVAQAIVVNVGAGKLGLGGNLNTPRSNHIAVLLPNNLVLVSGGVNNSVTLKSSELYDPVKNTWVATADMGTARTGHSAILLNNGKVLVTGGFDGTTALKTAEIYDPASRTWAVTTGPMTYSHNYHTSTALSDGKVLLAGGVLGPAINVDPKLTEVYDPILGTFSAGPSMPEPRQGHTSTVLQNGKVLFVGNSNGDATAARILTYTPPSTFAWPDLANPAVPTGSLTYGRWNHSATLLASGKVLVVGGFGNNPKSAELYDPTANTWTAAGNMAVGRAQHTSTLLRNGKVLIIGGYNGINALSSIELYDPTLGWSTATQKVLNTPRGSHTSVLLSNDNVLVLGTYLPNGGLASNSTEIWAP